MPVFISFPRDLRQSLANKNSLLTYLLTNTNLNLKHKPKSVELNTTWSTRWVLKIFLRNKSLKQVLECKEEKTIL